MNRFHQKNAMHRKDTSTGEIESAIKKEWPEVKIVDTSMVGNGFPDAILGIKGRTIFGEWKTIRHPELTEAEVKFHKEWKGCPIVRPRTAQEATAMIREILRSK